MLQPNIYFQKQQKYTNSKFSGEKSENTGFQSAAEIQDSGIYLYSVYMQGLGVTHTMLFSE